jgi:carbon storage regulator
MLVLCRKVGEEVVIGGGIRIRVVAVRGGTVRLGIAAPAGVRVDRQEVYEQRLKAAGWKPAVLEPDRLPG